MDVQQFLAEFGHIASAPDGIARLRELVYQFAITGRLTLQQEEDGTAEAALSSIARIRERLILEKKFKRSPKLESAPLTAPAIDLPPSWSWSRLLDLGEINPRNIVANEQESAVMATFVPMAAVSEKYSQAIAGEVRPWASVSKGYTHFANDDVLLAKITPCFENGKSAVVSGLEFDIGAGSTEFHVFRPISKDINPAYVYLFVRSPLFRAKGIASMTGAAGQKRLPTDYFASCAMPLPPTEEQYRIVAKVDELMALCDHLEAQQQKRRTLQTHLRQATLQAVAASQSPFELQRNWQRLEANFRLLFSAPEDVEALRAIVLDLAIAGYLSEASTEDEKIVAFLKRNESNKQARLNSGEMKRKKASSTDVYQLELEAPDHWAKVALEDLFQFIDYRGKTPPKTENGVILVTAKNVRPRRLNKEPIECISEKSYQEWMTRGFPRLGDLLITTEAPLGNVARIEEQPTFALAQRVINLQPFADVNTKCTMYFMMSPTYQNLLNRNSTGMTAKGIKAAKLKQLKLPIPPIQEQQRIVSRIEQLLSVCDELESSLSSASKVARALATTAVSALTGIAIEQEEEPMKTPKTELVAPVRLGTAPDIKAQAPLATILARHNGEMSAKDLWQRFGGEVDAFYAQLKNEVAHGWLLEPAPAEMLEK